MLNWWLPGCNNGFPLYVDQYQMTCLNEPADLDLHSLFKEHKICAQQDHGEEGWSI